jgi:hypothetical protein
MRGNIFINYRRADEPAYAMAVFCQLQRLFRSDQLFMDVENKIPAGADFVKILEDEVEKCHVMLVVVGPRWLIQHKLHNEGDFVRIEIEAALRLGKQIIPVLVNDAPMPRSEDLPAVLKPLARKQAVELAHERFGADTKTLCDAIIRALKEVVELSVLRKWQVGTRSRKVRISKTW